MAPVGETPQRLLVLGMGLLGVMIDLVARWITRAVLTLLRYARGIWQRDLST